MAYNPIEGDIQRGTGDDFIDMNSSEIPLIMNKYKQELCKPSKMI